MQLTKSLPQSTCFAKIIAKASKLAQVRVKTAGRKSSPINKENATEHVSDDLNKSFAENEAKMHRYLENN